MENSTTIKINGVNFKVKQSFRALMKFEEMTGRSVYKINESINDVMTLLFCILSANNRETFKFSFDEFIDLIDNNPTVIDDFNAYLLTVAADVTEETPSKKKLN